MKKLLIVGLLLAAGTAEARIKSRHHNGTKAPRLNQQKLHEQKLMTEAIKAAQIQIGSVIGMRVGLEDRGLSKIEINDNMKKIANVALIEAGIIEEWQNRRFSNSDINYMIRIWSQYNTTSKYKQMLIKHGLSKHKAETVVQNMINKAKTAAQKSIQKIKNAQHHSKINHPKYYHHNKR